MVWFLLSCDVPSPPLLTCFKTLSIVSLLHPLLYLALILPSLAVLLR